MANYRVVVDDVDVEEWHRLFDRFADACIHQSWAFGAGKWGKRRVSHLLLYDGEKLVAAAQVILVTLPVVRGGIAHCKFGPMWQLRGEPINTDIYSAVLMALRDEYSVNRGLVLSIRPFEVPFLADPLDQFRQDAGFQVQSHVPGYQTFVIDMRASLDDLRAGFKPKWRYNLKKSEARNIEVRRTTDASGADEYLALYQRMRDIKSYVDFSETELVNTLMTELPADLRPSVFMAYVEGEPAASIVISHIGYAAYYLYGATAPLGRDTGAAYRLFWEAMCWLKERDCRAFDLVGSRPQGTGGGAGYRRFKEGLVGRNGIETSQPDWEVCDRLTSRVIVQGGTLSRRYFRQSRHFVNGLFERARRAIRSKRT